MSEFSNHSADTTDGFDAATALEKVNSRVSTALSADWESYYQSIMALPRSFQIASSLKLLNAADVLINQSPTSETIALNEFEQSQPFQRAMLAGFSDQQTKKQYSFATHLLGSMESFASFKKVIKNDAAGIKRLLKIIPANGKIDGWHFMQFVDAYKALFAEHGFKQTHLFPATRLLTMRRPDQFFAISPETVDAVCHSLGIKLLKKQDFQRYWDEVIGTIQKTNWFKSEAYQINETGVFRARVALLERFFHFEDGLEEQQEAPLQAASNLDKSDNFGAATSSDAKSSGQTTHTEGTSNGDSIKIIDSDRADIENRVAKQVQMAKQPKKLTIAKRKSAKVNRNAATKLMSQYYFANKSTLPADKIKAKREEIIDQLVEGESVEIAFESVLKE
jgi:hypothetical protein